MTHNPDANVTMPTGVEGDGFVMWFDGMPVPPTEQPKTEPTREVWVGIADDLKDLERLLR